MRALNDWDIAEVCHEANRALQVVLNDENNPVNNHWDEVSEDLKTSAVLGVEKAREGYTPKALHNAWAQTRREQGWVYGETKDLEKKTHPCLVPYEDLLAGDLVKDQLFIAIVEALSDEEV